MQFREHRLENGLEVIAECNEHAYSTALAFFVKTGARDEAAQVAGVSHFLEHMVFKGTPRRTAAEVNRQLDEMGAHSNAYTSEEHTVYYATVLPEYQHAAVDLLADILRPSLRQEDFDTEKQVIIEEILKYEDQPPFGAHEKCMAAYFNGHPLGNNILGTVESVQGLTPEAMRAYFRQQYSPGNITLAAAGNVDFDQLVATAEDLCGSWEPFPVERSLARVPARRGFQVLQKKTAAQQYIVQITAGPSATDPDRYPSRVLATIIGDDTGSRFYWELIDPGLAEFAGMGPYEFQGTGILMTYVCCAPERAAENLGKLQQIQHQIEQQGVTAEELERAKNKICSYLVRQSERPSNRVFSIGNGWLQRREYRTVRERLQAYQQVDLKAVQAAIEKYPLTVNTTVAVGPLQDLTPLA